ncbi:hypothetical protein DL767_004420 [Monosporascus sp. MG133]|nr:hypothetical protein DL767_004420 [Monosporascus sp. MG133]
MPSSSSPQVPPEVAQVITRKQEGAARVARRRVLSGGTCSGTEVALPGARWAPEKKMRKRKTADERMRRRRDGREEGKEKREEEEEGPKGGGEGGGRGRGPRRIRVRGLATGGGGAWAGTGRFLADLCMHAPELPAGARS